MKNLKTKLIALVSAVTVLLTGCSVYNQTNKDAFPSISEIVEEYDMNYLNFFEVKNVETDENLYYFMSVETVKDLTKISEEESHDYVKNVFKNYAPNEALINGNIKNYVITSRSIFNHDTSSTYKLSALTYNNIQYIHEEVYINDADNNISFSSIITVTCKDGIDIINEEHFEEEKDGKKITNKEVDKDMRIYKLHLNRENKTITYEELLELYKLYSNESSKLNLK